MCQLALMLGGRAPAADGPGSNLKRGSLLLSALGLLLVGAISWGEDQRLAAKGAGALLVPPLVLDCGPPSDEEPWERDRQSAEERDPGSEPKLLRLRDRPWSPEAGYGFEGGEGYRHWIAAAWGLPEIAPFLSGRRDPGTYRFAIPPGRYVVTLGFCELAEWLPGRRSFHVLLEGKRAVEGLDPFATAGYGQAFRVSREVEVGAGGLRVGFEAQGPAPPEVCAIWIRPAGALGASGAPAPPLVGFRAVGSYGLNAVSWSPGEAPILGVIVERRLAGEGEFVPRMDQPFPASRWIDREVESGKSYEYRLRTVGLDGRAGPPGEPVSARARALEESALPVYSLEIPPEALARLLSDIREQRTAEARFSLQGKSWPVELRIRGASTRFAGKRGYRIEFDDEGPFPDRSVVYLKGEPFDFTLQEEKLTCDLLAALGLPVSSASYVGLLINGRYEGIYLDMEPVRRPLLRRAGLEGRGRLVRPSTFQRTGPRLDREAGSRELAGFIRRLNAVGRGEVEAFIRDEMDWPRVRDYLVASALCDRPEIEADDTFWHQDPVTERWLLIGWDFNNGHFGVPSCGRRIGRPRAPLYGQTIQGVGFQHGWWHLLPSRIFNCDRLRRDLLDRLEEKARELLLSGAVDRMVDANFEALRPEIPFDPFRWPPGETDPFAESAAGLKRFAREQGLRLLDLVSQEKGRAPSPIAIDEFGIGEDGGWVEVVNRSAEAVSLARCALTPGPVLREVVHRFGDDDRLGPGERRLVALTRGDPSRRDSEDLERLERDDPEAAERLGLMQGKPRGLDAKGGLIALVRLSESRERRSDDKPESGAGEILDLYFHGPLTAGVSYGRTASGFGFLRPTPGGPNPPEALAAPPFLEGARVERRQGRIESVRAQIPGWAGPISEISVALHYRVGAVWREAPMEVRACPQPSPAGIIGVAQADLDLVEPEAAGAIEYWLQARSRDGIERRAPVDAPRETYLSRPRGDD